MSYLWRNIIPYVTDTKRAIAIDLIGMGDMETISIGPGLHFIQEDNPQAIGEGISSWLGSSKRVK